MTKQFFQCKKSFKGKDGNIFESKFLVKSKDGEAFFSKLKSSYLFRCHTAGAHPSIQETCDTITFRYAGMNTNQIEATYKRLSAPI